MKHLFVLTLIVVLFSGCNRLTQSNFAKIKSGMSYEEVSAILGEASNCKGKFGITSCIWGDKEHYISIQFVADKATIFSQKNIK